MAERVGGVGRVGGVRSPHGMTERMGTLHGMTGHTGGH